MPVFFFFNDTATTEIYTLSLHDALPISGSGHVRRVGVRRRSVLSRSARRPRAGDLRGAPARADRKSTRLNSSHSQISYAVFCLKKKNNQRNFKVINEYRQKVEGACALVD